MRCMIQAARSIPLCLHYKISDSMHAVTGGCRYFSIPTSQHRRENITKIPVKHRDVLSGPGVWDWTKGCYVYYIFLTTSWYFSYLPQKCKDRSINGNVYMCESSRTNRRVRARRKVSMLAKDMMESHHMDKRWGKCCLLQGPEAGLQETVHSWSLWKYNRKTGSSSPVQRT